MFYFWSTVTLLEQGIFDMVRLSCELLITFTGNIEVTRTRRNDNNGKNDLQLFFIQLTLI